MGEKINIKTITITILAIMILLIGIFIVVKVINGNKNYVLEKISEKDYKYFGVVTDEKCGVIDLKREYDSRK